MGWDPAAGTNFGADFLQNAIYGKISGSRDLSMVSRSLSSISTSLVDDVDVWKVSRAFIDLELMSRDSRDISMTPRCEIFRWSRVNVRYFDDPEFMWDISMIPKISRDSRDSSMIPGCVHGCMYRWRLHSARCYRCIRENWLGISSVGMCFFVRCLTRYDLRIPHSSVFLRPVEMFLIPGIDSDQTVPAFPGRVISVTYLYTYLPGTY